MSKVIKDINRYPFPRVCFNIPNSIGNLFFLLFIFTYNFCYSQNNAIDAAINQEFISYSKFKSIENYGIIPSPLIVNFDNLIIPKSANTLPEKYDMREEGLLTSVKDQGGCGGCWNFVTYGAIESNWIKNGLGSFDLSEQNMRTCHGYMTFEDGSCSGGNHMIAGAYLSRRKGPILEELDIYNTNPDATCNDSLNPVAFVDEMVLLPDDRDVIKQTIMDYGGVYANMYWTNGAYSIVSKNYYYTGDNPVNHAVLIVGWDDNRGTTGGTGAWIAKNSWGTSWGENGYFYISYNDTKALSSTAIFQTRSDYDSLATIYMYDDLGATSSTGYNQTTGYGLVKYTATSKQKLIKLGTYVNAANATLDFFVYSIKSSNTLSNLICSVTNQKCTYPGYYVFDITSQCKFNEGETFYIKVKYNTPKYYYPIPVEKYIENYANPEIESDKCWISSNGSIWTALGNDISDGQKDLCIRVYAIPDTATTIPTKFSFEIYPNPNNDVLNVHFENNKATDAILEIFNPQGKIVFQKQISTNESNFVERINLSNNLSKGYYIVKITYNDDIFTDKFVLF